MRETCYRQVPDGPQDFDGSEDEYDCISDILVIKNKGKVVGGARIIGKSPYADYVLPLEEEGFTLENLFPDFSLQSTGHCEFGRLAVLPEYRDQSLLQSILYALSIQSVKRGYKYLFSMAPYTQARCYRMTFRALNFQNPYVIYNEIEIPQKSKAECGVLKMRLASLQFPKSLEDAKAIPVLPKVYRKTRKAA